ncbi:MAG: hypothetical protein ABIF45_17505 [Pseudomonadota bacterium]
MIMARLRPADPPPLFVWSELAAIDRLQAQREELMRRIALLRPHSFRRVELEARLRLVTAQQLELQNSIRDSRIGDRR